MQAEQPVEQHIYKRTVDRLKKVVAEVGIVAGVYKGFCRQRAPQCRRSPVLVLRD